MGGCPAGDDSIRGGGTFAELAAELEGSSTLDRAKRVASALDSMEHMMHAEDGKKPAIRPR